MKQNEHEQRIQIWVTRGLVCAILLLALFWGLMHEHAKYAGEDCDVRLKNMQKQTTMQGKEIE